MEQCVGPSNGKGLFHNNKTYAESVRNLNGYTKVVEAEACKSIFFKTIVEESLKFKNSMVGVMNKVGNSYGVSKSLIEDGVFTVVATPLGPNL